MYIYFLFLNKLCNVKKIQTGVSKKLPSHFLLDTLLHNPLPQGKLKGFTRFIETLPEMYVCASVSVCVELS